MHTTLWRLEHCLHREWLSWAVVSVGRVVYVGYGHSTLSLRDQNALVEMQEEKLECQLKQPVAIFKPTT